MRFTLGSDMMHDAAAPPPLSPDLEVVKKSKGPVMTVLEEFYKVGPGPSSSHTIGPDAHHLRLLPALHGASGGATREGDRHEGASVRQPERHRRRTRHRAGGARGHDRQGARDRRTRIPRQPRVESGSALSREAGGQDVHAHVEGHHLRSAQGRVPAPEHDDVQPDGRGRRPLRARVLLGRRRLHRVEGVSTSEERAAEVSRTRP